MRISIFLWSLGVFQCYAALSYGQDAQVSLKMKQASVVEILKQIEQETDLHFIYKSEDILKSETFDIDFKDKPVYEVLNEILPNTNLSFEVFDKYIAVRTATAMQNAMQQQKTIKGVVTDPSGEPLPGVSVVIKGTSTGTITSIDGNYTLQNVDEETIILFSFIGFENQEIHVTGRSTIDITMVEETTGLDEVVVVGYGVQKKVNVTGAVATVDAEVFENRPVTDATQALQGVVANLNITPNNSGGELGGSQNWNIRGAGSLEEGNDAPYILVDGVPMDISEVNPNDIESVSVLKDAASSAIYGSRAAFGVVLITTKQGKKGDKITVNYSNNVGFVSATNLPENASSVDFANTYNAARVNNGQTAFFSDEQIALMQAYIDDPESVPVAQTWPANHPHYGKWGAHLYANGNTDWYDTYFGGAKMKQTHNVSVRGGTEKSSFYLSGGYLNQDGLLNFGTDNYKRYNISTRVSTQINSWMQVRLDTKFSRRMTEFPNMKLSTTSNKAGFYHNIARHWPTNFVYDPDGRLQWASDPISMVEGGGSTRTQNAYWLTGGMTITPLEGWDIVADYSWNNENSVDVTQINTVYGTYASYTERDGEKFIVTGDPNSLTKQYDNNTYYTLNLYSSYAKKVKEHSFKVMVGYQEEEKQLGMMKGINTDIITQYVPSFSTSVGEDPILSDALSHWSTMGFFGRFNYNYKEKYLFEFNGRYDGSSRFAKDNRWGFFPSMSVGYRISEEPFWEKIEPYVQNLKLRGSYGSLGNQNVANYLYISMLDIKKNLPYYLEEGRPIYTQAPNLKSANLTWETSSTLDLGLDASFLNSKLGVVFDWYKRTTKDMLGPAHALPSTLGADVPKENNATLETKGIELSLTWRDKIGAVNYDVSVLLSDNQTTVTSYDNPTKILTTYYEGQKLGEIWGYTSNGLFQSDEEAANWENDQSFLHKVWKGGDVRYIDLDGNNIINTGDNTVDNPGDRSVIGNSTPRYSYGIKGGLNWKGIDFSMFWQGVAKRDLALGGNVFWGVTGSPWHSSVFKEHLNYWTEDNTNAYYPRPIMNGGQSRKNQQVQTRYLQSGAYIRLKSIQLGYTLPKVWMDKINMNSIRVFAVAENLLTFSKMSDIFDPEATGGAWANGKIYPLNKTISMGVNVTF
ncbi:TonB-dependent receptor [Carboxylicivirga marina]|uniref:TonB-dependent receptor n=1 Tax=Carboxylicivirga marina TaxID=2800988 RepID=UPI0025955F2E|nr:TonB-dependent receptor [uncultured Carboxylicivirga sp.]